MLENGEREPMEINVGDIVLFAKYAGTDVKINDETLKIVSIKDTLAIIE